MDSEIRRELATKRWGIIATKRSKRPTDYSSKGEKDEKKLKESPETCAFCPGNESKTPPEILTYRINGDTKWKIRVVPNKFGALSIEGELQKEKTGVLRRMNGRGAHEVIISTPHHAKTIFQFSQEEMNDLLWACKDRILDLAKAKDEKNDPKIEYIIIFGNHGKEAGASKEHAHWQLIGLPIIPPESWNEIESCREYWSNENECLFCSLIKQERNAKERFICENDFFVAWCHYAGRVPFETWILPKNHWPLFEDGNAKTLKALADILVETLGRIGKTLDFPPFNIFFHNAPLQNRTHDRYYDFHIEIIPRVTIQAGFELGTGLFINPTAPEEAAKFLREATL